LSVKFIVHMRDGSTFLIEALYIEVVASVESSYTFLGRVPGFPRAIMASFPVDLVSAVVPVGGGSPPPPGAAAPTPT